MHLLGTENSRPAHLTSMVAGTTCHDTSPTSAESTDSRGMGPRASFSLRKSSSGGRPVVRFGSSSLLAHTRAIARSSPSQPSKSPSEPCQYNGQRSRRFPCGQHGFRIGLEGTLEAVEELLHGLCRHAVPDGLVRAEAVVIRLDELDRPVLRRGCIRRALVVVPLALERPEERL